MQPARATFVLVATMLLAVLAVLLSACDAAGGAADPEAGSDDAGPVVVRIGFAGDIGSEAGSDARLLRAVELAVKDANNSSEVDEAGYQFAVHAVDDQGDLELGHGAAEELVGDETVIAVIGHQSSDVTLVAASVYAGAGLPLITTATSPLITHRGHDSVNRIVPSEDAQGAFAARLAFQSLELTTAVVVDDASFHGKAAAEAFAAEFVEAGGPVLAHLQVDPVEPDYTEMAESITRFDPSAVFVGFAAACPESLSLELRSLGVTAPAIFLGTCGQEHAAGARESVEGDISVRVGVPLGESSAGRDFAVYFETTYGEPPGELDAFAYDAAWAIVRSVVAVGAEREDVAQALRRTEFAGVTGATVFDGDGDTTNRAMAAYRVVDGVWERIP